MSKLSFRARALDATKPMPIYLAEEIPDLPEYSAINRAVPQMPSGMEKEEECEHHLQRAICAGLIIPTPEVFAVEEVEFYDRCYPADYKMPKQHIHMQPLWQEQEAPEYDIDSDDDRWLKQQRHPELTEDKFEEMMDKLERCSGQTVVTLQEAKLLLERSDDLVIAVYDYWLNKRLKTQHPLILTVRTESRPGQAANNPYLAFRRRTEKMQTRKNRKNDESSYEKMLKLRRELARALSLLEMVGRREKLKRSAVRLRAAIADTRYRAKDFAGDLLPDTTHNTITSRPTVSAPRRSPPRVATVHTHTHTHTHPHTHLHTHTHTHDPPRQREKRPYTKRRKHRHPTTAHVPRECGVYSSSSEESRTEPSAAAAATDDGPYAFRRKPGCYYEMPTATLLGDPLDPERTGQDAIYKHEVDERYRYSLTSLRGPEGHCVGLARARVGRGGRLLLDRRSTPLDDLWPKLRFHFTHTTRYKEERAEEVELETKLHRNPKELVRDYESTSKYPWRRSFREHLRTNHHLWIDEPSPPTTTTLFEDISDVKCEQSDNISVNVDRTDSKCTSDVRKRSHSECDSGSSSYDSDDSLVPVEKEFENFLDEVNKKWLHFRPKTPPLTRKSPPRADNTQIPVTLDTAIAVELTSTELPSSTLDSFTTSEFTLRELYGDNIIQENDNSGTSLDISNEDLLNENLGLTEAQVESILSETDLKALDEDLKDDKRIPEDLLEELVKDVEGKDFLGKTRRREKESFGCTVVNVTPLTPAEPIYIDKLEPPKPPKLEVKPKEEKLAPPPTPVPAPKPQLAPPTSRAPPLPPLTPVAQIAQTTMPTHSNRAQATVRVKNEPPPLAPVPNNKIILEEVNDLAHIKVEPKPKPQVARPKAEPEVQTHRETLEEVTLPRGVQLKTVHNPHSPLKKHIISSAHRRDNITLPQIVTVAVSDTLKVRLQNHVLASQASSEAQNGPHYTAIHQVTATNTVTARDIAETLSVSSAQLSNLTTVGSLSTVGSLGTAVATVGTSVGNVGNAVGTVGTVGRRVVLAAAPPHNVHSKLKVVPNTIQARAQILGGRGHVVSVGGGQLALKPAPAQYIEIKPGHLLLRHHPPQASQSTHNQPVQTQHNARTRLELDSTKRRHLVATNIGVPNRPHKVSVSLDGRQIVRATVPVRAPIHHQIQLKNRTLLATPHITNNEASGSITITAPTKTASITSIPSSVVANLLQKNVQLPKSGQKIAIASGALATIRGRQRLVTRTHSTQGGGESGSGGNTGTGGAEGDARMPVT